MGKCRVEVSSFFIGRMFFFRDDSCSVTETEEGWLLWCVGGERPVVDCKGPVSSLDVDEAACCVETT